MVIHPKFMFRKKCSSNTILAKTEVNNDSRYRKAPACAAVISSRESNQKMYAMPVEQIPRNHTLCQPVFVMAGISTNPLVAKNWMLVSSQPVNIVWSVNRQQDDHTAEDIMQCQDKLIHKFSCFNW
jgi:hypothetical protein